MLYEVITVADAVGERLARLGGDFQVLKPHLNTRPKVYYASLDGEVR